jgi:hypothetical protein
MGTGFTGIRWVGLGESRSTEADYFTDFNSSFYRIHLKAKERAVRFACAKILPTAARWRSTHSTADIGCLDTFDTLDSLDSLRHKWPKFGILDVIYRCESLHVHY